jgi:mRNA interferase MazF
MGMEVTNTSRFDVFLVFLGPSQGHEVKKARPCVIISPDEMNGYLRTLIVAPIAPTIKLYPTRVHIFFDGKRGSIMLDQIRTIDKTRLIRKIGSLEPKSSFLVLRTLQKMFSA